VATIENHRFSARDMLLMGLNAFSGSFAKLRKATIGFVVSVRPHGKKNSASTGGIFIKKWYLNIFRKSVENIQVSLKCDRNDSYFTRRPI